MAEKNLSKFSVVKSDNKIVCFWLLQLIICGLCVLYREAKPVDHKEHSMAKSKDWSDWTSKVSQKNVRLFHILEALTGYQVNLTVLADELYPAGAVDNPKRSKLGALKMVLRGINKNITRFHAPYTLIRDKGSAGLHHK
jgi:hypothetical protein